MQAMEQNVAEMEALQTLLALTGEDHIDLVSFSDDEDVMVIYE